MLPPSRLCHKRNIFKIILGLFFRVTTDDVDVDPYDPKTLEDHKAHFIAGHGGYPLVGTPLQIADELGRLADIGVDGCLISWVDYMDELKQWNAEVLPLLVQSGLRQPFAAAAQSKTAVNAQDAAVS